MEISVPSLLLGLAGAGAGYFVYLAATKGLSAAVAWAKAKWAAGTSELSAVVSTVEKDVAALKTDVAAVKAKLGI